MLLWLNRLFASKQRLVGGPNFNQAPWRTLNISGTVIRFKNPPKSSGIANQHWPEMIDLYKEDYEEWNEGDGLSKNIFENFWCYFDHLLWGEGSIGTCSIYIYTASFASQLDNSIHAGPERLSGLDSDSMQKSSREV
ncbi:MAG: hypothetical protein ACR2PX_22220 [Endozoicomonas sp.]|uniref:hypothetical protein n=1 Tax=Endozoicomonas sp. TaxID=1892382 RepID=UPI003D9BABEF